ncbi:Farnesylcysteine lyase [Paramyrothecium foliicola]|nr:Farnesylcysteine lyase [Paramyrothecium foliicola]
MLIDVFLVVQNPNENPDLLIATMKAYLSLALTWVNTVGFVIAVSPISTREVKNVAIIGHRPDQSVFTVLTRALGAGAAGSSAAFHLQEYADDLGLAINITIFEKTDRVGGRTLTVNAYDDPAIPVELGASIFVSVNHIMTSAVARYGLDTRDIDGPGADDITAIWDGESFVYKSAKGTAWWWDATKMWWKYGTSPYTTMKLVKSTVDKFLSLYDPPHFPFRSLTQRAFELGLERITGMTGEQFLENNKVSLATDGAVAVVGGNWQIFQRMVRDSGAALYCNTSVTNISFEKTKDKSASQSKYIISTKTSNSKSARVEAFPVAFDNVVVANPWQYSDIQAGEGVLKHIIDKIPYMKLHVTLFTSPFKLRPGFFNLPAGSKAPSNVYTTLRPGEKGGRGPDGAGLPGFYSVSTLLAVVNPKTGNREFLYKIFSPKAVTPEFLSDILGANVPSTFTSSKKDNEGSPQMVDAISWYYPHWFHSYPIELPRVTFQDPVVGNGLYYTSGIESFISCMETSALMGSNVARLIAEDFAGLSSGDDEVWEDFLKDLREGTKEKLQEQDMGEL